MGLCLGPIFTFDHHFGLGKALINVASSARVTASCFAAGINKKPPEGALIVVPSKSRIVARSMPIERSA